MRFYKPTTKYCCGVDLHNRNLYVCIVDRDGEIHRHRSMRSKGRELLGVIEPFRGDVTVSVECTFSWYWVADLCRREEIPFALGHALYMGAIHGAKKKNDRVDSEKIARLTASGLLPMAYVYPWENRATRDLLRRRLRFVRQRAELYTHTHHLNTQCHLDPIGYAVKSRPQRKSLSERFTDPEVRMNVEANLTMIEHLDELIQKLEKHILTKAKANYQKELTLLLTIPGVGPITALTILYEIDTIDRFETRQQFASYARLVKCRHESDGKNYGHGGKKIGNPYLKWAFSEAAVHAVEYCEPVKKVYNRLARKHGNGKGRSLLAHKLGRSVYHMLLRGQVFDVQRFAKTG
ncbi:MAG: IS110 family transposase [Planctomycetes bacterium]|nr:IS110 family transposase [Planctomycetota bacterium]